MNTKNKTGKFRIIFRFLKGNIRFFVGTLLFSVLFTACNALIPQIVKYTADHILVLDGIPDGLNVRQTLLLSALLVAASAVLSGFHPAPEYGLLCISRSVGSTHYML